MTSDGTDDGDFQSRQTQQLQDTPVPDSLRCWVKIRHQLYDRDICGLGTVLHQLESNRPNGLDAGTVANQLQKVSHWQRLLQSIEPPALWDKFTKLERVNGVPNSSSRLCLDLARAGASQKAAEA